MTHKIRNNFRNLFGRSIDRTKNIETGADVEGCPFLIGKGLYDGLPKNCPQDYKTCSDYQKLMKK